MRFFLDHDVSADVARSLRRRGHEVWTASDARLSRAGDEDLTVYAAEQRACVITHDREFSVRRRSNVIGWHVWLACPEPEAAPVVEAQLPELLALLEHNPDVMVRVTRSRVTPYFNWR